MKSKVTALAITIAVLMMGAQSAFAAPTELQATVNDDMQVVLTWMDSGHADLESEQLLKSMGEGVEPTEAVVFIDKGVETYTDTDVVEGDVVNYRLREKYDDGTFGPFSETVTVTVVAAVEETPAEETPAEETTCAEGDETCAGEETATEDETAVEEESATETVELSDIADHWAVAEIEALVAEGVLMGNPDGTFDPNGNMDRAEAAAVLYRVLGFDEPELPEANPFPDVDAGAWYAGYVSNMKAMDMIHGYGDGTYKPGNEITRGEFTKLALEVYYYLNTDEEVRATIDGYMEGEMTNMFSDLEDTWYSPYVTASGEMGFINGFACGRGRCFGAENNITRAEAAVILNNMFIDLITAPAEETTTEEETAA